MNNKELADWIDDQLENKKAKWVPIHEELLNMATSQSRNDTMNFILRTYEGNDRLIAMYIMGFVVGHYMGCTSIPSTIVANQDTIRDILDNLSKK